MEDSLSSHIFFFLFFFSTAEKYIIMGDCTSIIYDLISQSLKTGLSAKVYIHIPYIHKHHIVFLKDYLTSQIKNVLDLTSLIGSFQHQSKIDVKVYINRIVVASHPYSIKEKHCTIYLPTQVTVQCIRYLNHC